MSKEYASEQNPHGVKVGDLFTLSYGYDQTNVHYFQVTRTSVKGVWVREIGAKSVPGTQGFMCENVTPTKDNFLKKSQWCGDWNSENPTDLNPETFRRVNVSTRNDGSRNVYFNFKGRYFAHPCAVGSTTYNSWYA